MRFSRILQSKKDKETSERERERERERYEMQREREEFTGILGGFQKIHSLLSFFFCYFFRGWGVGVGGRQGRSVALYSDSPVGFAGKIRITGQLRAASRRLRCKHACWIQWIQYARAGGKKYQSNHSVVKHYHWRRPSVLRSLIPPLIRIENVSDNQINNSSDIPQWSIYSVLFFGFLFFSTYIFVSFSV